MIEETAKELSELREKFESKQSALRELILHIEDAKDSYKNEVCSRIASVLGPILSELRSGKPPSGTVLNRLEDILESIVNRDLDKSEMNVDSLSPREFEVMNLISKNYASKQIADKLHISLRTVGKHRELIRKKLDLGGKKINLSTFLRHKQVFTFTH